MNQKEALKLIRATGAKVRIVDGEYQVNIPGGRESTIYYTDDAHDAIGTANVMMRQYHIRHKKKFGILGA